MVRTSMLGAVALLVVGYGIAVGLWTNRWKASDDLRQAVESLNQVPMKIGDWRGENLPTDPEVMSVGRIDGFLSRVYRNQRTGQGLTLMIVCGRPGPISVHTPDVCFRGRGYVLDGDAKHENLAPATASAPADFWHGYFVNEGNVEGEEEAYWSWNATGTWQAPQNPRWTFAARRVLYKLYLVRGIGKRPAKDSRSAVNAFADVLLPVLQKSLFSPR